ncbi:hypothetical protein TeGR_g2239, partial [Tetraparma gracilis]
GEEEEEEAAGVGRGLGKVVEEGGGTDDSRDEDEDGMSEDESEYDHDGDGSDDDEEGGSPRHRRESGEIVSLKGADGVLTEAEKKALESMVNGVHNTPNPWTTRLDGGVDCLFTSAGRSSEIYFSGIIDILQQYNSRKRAETFFKGLMFDTKQISCVDPKWYAQRFLNYMEQMME